MGRCVICDYSSDVDGRLSDNYIDDSHDICIKCAGIVHDTLEEFGDEEEDPGSYLEYPLEAPNLTVQSDPGEGGYPSSLEISARPEPSEEDFEIEDSQVPPTLS